MQNRQDVFIIENVRQFLRTGRAQVAGAVTRGGVRKNVHSENDRSFGSQLVQIALQPGELLIVEVRVLDAGFFVGVQDDKVHPLIGEGIIGIALFGGNGIADFLRLAVVIAQGFIRSDA